MSAGSPRRGRDQLAAGRRRGRGRGHRRDRLTGTPTMNEGAEPITLRVHSAINEIAGGPVGCLRRRHQPDRLARLPERARGKRLGDGARRLGTAASVFADASGRLIGAVPMYLKSHSYGEYVFDWGWADAYERSGGRYYPKLLCAVPFTPVPGPRLLVAPDAPAVTRSHLVAGMVELARQRKLSSLHVNFPEHGRFRGVRRSRLPAADRPAIPLEQQRLPRFRRLSSRRSTRASARRSRKNGARPWPAASRSTC